MTNVPLRKSSTEERNLNSYEYAIIGGGPNGILLANRLIEGGRQVLLIEAGGFNKTEGFLTRDNYEFVTPSKIPIGIHTLGGGSTQWLGRVGQFIQSDFISHSNRTTSWPIAPEQLNEPFRKVFSLTTGSEKLDEEHLQGHKELSKLKDSMPPWMNLRLFRFSKLDLYENLVTELLNNEKFTLLPQTTCLEVLPNSGSGYSLDIASSNFKEKPQRIQADKVVIAGGTLQSTALLMRSKNLTIPAREKYIGKYLMEHFDGFVGSLIVRKNDLPILKNFLLNLDRTWNSNNFGIAFSLSDATLTREGMPNLHFEVCKYKKKFIFERHTYIFSLPELHRKIIHLIERLVRKCIDPLQSIYDFLVQQNRYTIWMKGEEFPNLSSTLELSEDRDAQGMQRVIYNHRISAETSKQVRQEITIIRKMMADSKLGKFRPYRHLMNQKRNFYLNPNWHPMGTLRMGPSENEGVCDQNLEVFNNPGLFLLNAGVFPSGSNQNPTSMVMALGERLAQRLIK
jgi:choline dehydrogenase-like flavoprotein